MAKHFGEIKSFYFIQPEQAFDNVRLSLFNAKVDHVKFSDFHIEQFMSRHQQLLLVHIEEEYENDSHKVVFVFETVEDAIDFQQQEKNRLSYSMAKIQSFEEGQKNQVESIISNYSDRLIQQIDQQGFQFKNGEIHMKRITSVELLIDPDEFIKGDESTMIQTEKKISIDQHFQEEEQVQKAETEDKTVILKKCVKPFFDSLLFTGFVYGGYKLLKLFLK